MVGAFTEYNIQIGFARAISDKTGFAYIMDVIVDENYRRLGIGQGMVRQIITHPDLEDVYQHLLITKDAHGVYKKVGFDHITRPNDGLKKRHKRPER